MKGTARLLIGGAAILATLLSAPVGTSTLAAHAAAAAASQDVLVLRAGTGAQASLVALPAGDQRAAHQLPLGLLNRAGRILYAAAAEGGNRTLLRAIDVVTGQTLRSVTLVGAYSTRTGDYRLATALTSAPLQASAHAVFSTLAATSGILASRPPAVAAGGIPADTTETIVAHPGVLYSILALDQPNLQPGERQILAGLYFTARHGAVTPPPGGALAAVNLNPCAAADPASSAGPSAGQPRLTVRTSGGMVSGFVWSALSGTSFRGGTTVHLRLCWSGLPRYTMYGDLGSVAASSAGTFVVRRSIPLSSYPRNVYAVGALATGAAGDTLATASTRFWPAGPGIPVRASMRLLPATVKPGQRFTVVVSGARPKEVLDFVAAPDFATGGFGGGIMGRHQANKAGIIRFTYPAPTGSGAVGTWVITAQRRGYPTTNIAAFATLTVAPPAASSHDLSGPVHPSSGVLRALSLPAHPLAVAVDARTSRAFVTADNGTVSVLATASARLLRTVRVGADPSAVTVDTRTGRVFVVNQGDDSVSVLDASSGRVLRTVAVGAQPQALAVAESAGRVFIANYQGETVSVLNSAGGTPLTTLAVGPYPSAVAVDDRTGRVFVTHDNADSVFDVRTDALVATIVTGQYAGTVAVDASTGRAFVTHFGKGGRVDNVSTLDARTGRVLKTVPLNGGPGAMAVDEGTGRVFVVRLKANRVAVLDARSGALLGNTLVGDFPLAIAVDPATNRVFVANHDSNSVSVLDAHTSVLLHTIPVGRGPSMLAVDVRAGRMLVANYEGNSVSILDARY